MREAASFIANQSNESAVGALSRVVDAAGRAFRAWKSRRKLMQLNDFDDHILCDIGITREEVRWALDQPFLHDPAGELGRRAGRGRESRWQCTAL